MHGVPVASPLDWTDPDRLVAAQSRLASADPPPWRPGTDPLRAAGCFIAFARGEQGPGHAGDHAWAGAALVGEDGTVLAEVVQPGTADASYVPGLLALREGRLLYEAVRALPRPDVLLVDATGRDHPRGAGLALHLGAVLEVPTVGITHRPLTWRQEPPPLTGLGATTPAVHDGRVVGTWVCTSAGARPVLAHAGWRTDPSVAAEVARRTSCGACTPEPLRVARTLARNARRPAT